MLVDIDYTDCIIPPYSLEDIMKTLPTLIEALDQLVRACGLIDEGLYLFALTQAQTVLAMHQNAIALASHSNVEEVYHA